MTTRPKPAICHCSLSVPLCYSPQVPGQCPIPEAHSGEPHLHRYLTEFDFRYNRRIARGFNDRARIHALLRGAASRRLMYRRIGRAQETPKGRAA